MTNASGQCTIIITSSAAGQSSVSAVAPSVSYAGQTFTNVSTDGTLPNSGPGVKTWKDLRISITPQDDTNRVNDSHTFTVTVEQSSGNNVWTGVSGVNPSLSVSPTPSTPPPATCGPTTAAGVCTFTINSNAPGTFTANASVTYAVAPGQTLTRDTAANSGPGGTDSALKKYANVRIQITPGRRQCGRQLSHTFTVTLQGTVDGTTGLRSRTR